MLEWPRRSERASVPDASSTTAISPESLAAHSASPLALTTTWFTSSEQKAKRRSGAEASSGCGVSATRRLR